MPQEDHDLLIRIATQVERLISDVADIKTNVVGRVEKLEIEKAEKKDIICLSDRISKLENRKRKMIGMGVIIGTISSALVGLVINTLAKKL